MHRFVCDAMLGSLARWLRFLGYDTEFLAGTDDDVVAELARREGRWLLTRDRELASVGPRSMLVRAEGLDEQLREVLGRLDLHPAPTLERSRCGECNGELEEARVEDVADSVPPFVAHTAERFRRCRGCGRVYWPGTHTERILARLQRVVGRVD